jgi:hypothetical protein
LKKYIVGDKSLRRSEVRENERRGKIDCWVHIWKPVMMKSINDYEAMKSDRLYTRFIVYLAEQRKLGVVT